MTIDTPVVPIEKLSFPLQDGERVLRICRRHWLYLWPNLIVQVLIALIPVVAIGVLLSEAGAYEGVVANIYWIAVLLWGAFWMFRLFLMWYQYQNDVWVITNQRIVDSIKRHPFSLRVSTADLVNVQDMTVERDGPLRTMFDYGDVLCQTAGDVQTFRISGVPQPRDLQALVDKERDRERMRVRGL